MARKKVAVKAHKRQKVKGYGDKVVEVKAYKRKARKKKAKKAKKAKKS